jgi:hypothetical protein
MRWRAPVRWLVVSALVVTSLAGLVVTQPTRGVRVEREFAASLADFRAGELYVSPELSSFLTVYTGNTRPAGVTIHLLEEGAQSDGWQAVRALWPDAPVVTRLSEMRSGHAAFFRALNPARVPSGWRPVAEFATLTPPLTLRSIGVLQALGVPRSIVRRLLPGQDRSIFVYAID